MADDAGVEVFLGDRGMGKSTLLRHRVDVLLTKEHGRNVAMVYDPRRDDAWKGVRRMSLVAFRKATSTPSLVAFGVETNLLDMVAAGVELAERSALRVVLVVDELDRLYPRGRYLDDPPPGPKWHPGPSRMVAHEGRHIGKRGQGVDVLGSARRPINLHPDVAELATRIYIFRTAGRNSRKWILDTCGDGWDEAARQLPPHRYLEWTPTAELPSTQGKQRQLKLV